MIHPRCKSDMFQVYISADGIVMPCCWIGNAQFVGQYRKLHQNNLEKLSVEHRELDEILADPIFKSIEKTWETDSPLPVCQLHCGKKVETHEEERQGADLRATLNFPDDSSN